MNVATLTHALVFCADSFFLGLKFIVPLLFVLNLISGISNRKYFISAFHTAGILMLLAAILFLATIAINMLTAWFAQNEDERDLMIYILTGPNWFQVVIPIISLGIVPQLLWNLKLRNSITALFNIVIVWWIGAIAVNHFSSSSMPLLPDFVNSTDRMKLLLFITLFFAITIFKYNRSKS